ncbi:MAG: adenosine-specific kinase [Nitrososphaeria archaeon]
MDIEEVELSVPEGYNIILGQSHFIKTVEDIYEAIVTTSTEIKFGIAFCESSGKALIRFDGTDKECIDLAVSSASLIGAGHSFIIYLKGGFPINILDRIKAIQEVVSIYAATANPIDILIADNGKGRGILGIIDGIKPKGVEGPQDKEERRAFLRKIGYKR